VSTLTEVEQSITELAELVSQARGLVGSSESIDLNGLTARTQGVCERIAELEPELARRLESRLASLIVELDELASQVGAQHSELSELLNELEPQGPGSGDG
jgi:predicted Rossmann fold nucleotide-binding protein DprA/Smf involved in DNA uptake